MSPQTFLCTYGSHKELSLGHCKARGVSAFSTFARGIPSLKHRGQTSWLFEKKPQGQRIVFLIGYFIKIYHLTSFHSKKMFASLQRVCVFSSKYLPPSTACQTGTWDLCLGSRTPSPRCGAMFSLQLPEAGPWTGLRVRQASPLTGGAMTSSRIVLFSPPGSILPTHPPPHLQATHTKGGAWPQHLDVP